MENPKRALVTLAIGDAYEKLGRVTHPSLIAYAKKNNAEFIVINKPKYVDKLKLLTYEKLQVWELLDGRYDQIAFVDTDILIAPDAPSVFDMCPLDTFGAVSEEAYSMSKVHRSVTQDKLGKVSWVNPYFNSGVMVFGVEHREMFNPSSKILDNWISDTNNQDHVMSDQPILNYLVNRLNFKMIDFGYKFNHTRVIRNTKIRFRSYFIHYAGPSGHRYGTRYEQMKKDAGVLNSPVNLFLSRKIPWFRWVIDRLDIEFLKYLGGKYK